MPLPHSPLTRARADGLAALRVLVGALSHSARAVEQRTGVTNAQLFLLQQIAEHGPQSVGELAARAQTQASTASIVVSRLVVAGLLRKDRATDDARRVSLSLTPAARRIVRFAPTPPTALLLGAFDRLTPAETRALAAGLRAVLREMHLPESEPSLLFEHTAPRRARRTLAPRRAK